MCKWPGVLMAALGLLVWLVGDRLLMNYAPQNQAGSERIADVAYGGRVLGFADQDFKRWSVPVGFELRRLADLPGQARLTVAPGQDSLASGQEWEEQGVIWPLAKEYAHVFDGQRLRISVQARAAGPGPAPVELAVLYASRQAGNTGWQLFALSEQYQTYSFSFQMPALTRVDEESPFLILRPASTGPENAVIVREAAISLVPGDD